MALAKSRGNVLEDSSVSASAGLDSDGDGAIEITLGSDRTSQDSDGDGVPDKAVTADGKPVTNLIEFQKLKIVEATRGSAKRGGGGCAGGESGVLGSAWVLACLRARRRRAQA